jgi:hypothetical protein
MSSTNEYPEEIWGIEDFRITFVPELQQDTWSPTPLIPVAPRSVVGLDLSGSATSLQSQSLGCELSCSDSPVDTCHSLFYLSV